jgi:hypothetical protein
MTVPATLGNYHDPVGKVPDRHRVSLGGEEPAIDNRHHSAGQRPAHYRSTVARHVGADTGRPIDHEGNELGLALGEVMWTQSKMRRGVSSEACEDFTETASATATECTLRIAVSCVREPTQESRRRRKWRGCHPLGPPRRDAFVTQDG